VTYGAIALGKRAIASLYADLFDIPMALGSVSNLEARTSDALSPIHD
jgi:transposase